VRWQQRKAELADDMKRQAEDRQWSAAVSDFMAGPGADIAKSRAALVAFDEFVKHVTADPANARLSDRAQLDKAFKLFNADMNSIRRHGCARRRVHWFGARLRRPGPAGWRARTRKPSSAPLVGCRRMSRTPARDTPGEPGRGAPVFQMRRATPSDDSNRGVPPMLKTPATDALAGGGRFAAAINATLTGCVVTKSSQRLLGAVPSSS
jgi:hypothetical protein